MSGPQPAPNPVTVSAADLPLANLWRWETERGGEPFMTQPLGGGAVQTLTWAQAASEVRRLAAWLQAQGWPAGSRVAVLGKNSAHWLLADLAIWAAGHVSVPLYPTLGAQDLAQVLTHSEARACFVGKLDDIAALQDGVPPGLPCLRLPLAPALDGALDWMALRGQFAPIGGQPRRGADELATLIYTSGTTGAPKGVMLTFGALAWTLSCALVRRPLGPAERFISYLPLAHIAERMMIELGGLRAGGQIFFAESLDSFVTDLRRARPTLFLSVPRLWIKFQQGVNARLPQPKLARLLRLPLVGRLLRRRVLAGLGLDCCRIAITGGAPMPGECLGWWRALGLDLVEVYGLTELSGLSHGTPPGSFMPGTVGTTYEGVQSRIDAETGEVQLQSPGQMLGYFRDDEASARALTPDGWLRTGDQGSLGPDGRLRITGRLVDSFKTTKGRFIVPTGIEARLGEHDDLEACVVTGRGLDQPLGLLLLGAAAVARAADPAGRAALVHALNAHLDALNATLQGHERLARLVVFTEAWTPDGGLVTPTMKVRRAAVDARFGAHYPRWAAQPDAVVWANAEQ
jgi:long-chain acyl-CoA synthetase